jgi:hypothetical protein
MKNSIIIAAFVWTSISFFACKPKENPLDNSNTIKVPYAMFMGTRHGDVLKTNDAESFNTIRYGAGAFLNCIWVLDTNILFQNNKVNVGNGMVPLEQIDLAFRPEPSFNSLVKNSSITEEGYPNTVCYDPAQKIVYACGLDLFLHQSTKNGAIGTWTNSPFATTSSVLRSITRTDNGDVFALDFSDDLYKRSGGVGNFVKVVPAAGKGLPSGGGQFYFISHINNRLTASDVEGISGIYYSDDFGVNWNKITGWPAKSRFLMGKQVAYNGDYYTSLDSLGLYKMVGNSIVRIDAGLPQYTRIWDIVGKRNVYRTDVAKYYFYIATDKGLYQSRNNMLDWELKYKEDVTALY